MVDSLKGLGTLKLAAMVAVSILLLLFFVMLTLRVSSPAMAPLYSNLPVEDSATIVQELESKNIPYELRANGSQILVPADQALRLRLDMASQGLPSQGSLVGYEVFDRSEALGTSNFVHNVNLIRALEGELGRTISSMATIEKARVHLVMPRRELFTREKQEPSASVVVHLRGAMELGKQEIASIQHLVASAVPQLKPSKITIVDNKGRLLARGVDDENEPGVMAERAEEYRVNFENRMARMLTHLVEQSVGMNKVKVQIAADIDFDRIVTNSETFDPESQVARSKQTVEEAENSQEKDLQDNVSVANNLPDKNASQAGTLTQTTTSRTEETINYEISKVVKNHIAETGDINKLSVAVLVDGTYTTNDAGEKQYVARSQEELDRIKTLVRSAIGFDEKRGDVVEVVNMPFFTDEEETAEEPLAFLKDDLHSILQTVVMGVVAILAILLVIRPLVNRALERSAQAEEEEAEMKAALSGPDVLEQLTDQSSAEGTDEEEMIDIAKIGSKVKSSSYRKINEIFEKHPEETLAVLRQWMFNEA